MRDQMGATDPERARPAGRKKLASLPDVVVSSLSFEDDAIRVDGAMSVPSTDPAPVNTSRSLAASVPGDAIFFADAPNVGASAAAQLSRLREQLQNGGANGELDQLQQVEAALGGRLDELFGWVGGAAVAAGWDGDQAYVGMVLEVTDADAATERLRQLKNLLSLATIDPSAEVKVTTDTVAGVEVTSIRFTTMTPTFSSDGGRDGGSHPVRDGWRPRAHRGGGSVFGRVLQLAAGQSLADDGRYTAAINRFGGNDNAGAFFLDLGALRETVEAEASDMLPPEYATDIQPHLEPLDLLAGVTRVESGAMVTRYGLVLRSDRFISARQRAGLRRIGCRGTSRRPWRLSG